MPTEEQFQEAYSTLTKYPLAIFEHTKLTEKLFPDRDDRHQFRKWLSNRAANAGPKLLLPATFIDNVDNKVLTARPFIQEFNYAMRHHRPEVPIGSDEKFLYRLRAHPELLISQDQDNSLLGKDGSLSPTYFLGLNTTVQPKEPAGPVNRRRANLSDKSEASAEGDDDAPGFIFFQLGELVAAWHRGCEKEWSPAHIKEVLDKYPVENEDNYEWHDTGFVLVSRLDYFGRNEGTYAIYNMFPHHPETYRREQITHTKWGIPPTQDDQFSTARIGNSLSELGFTKRMVWTEKIEHPIELVRVKRAGNSLGLLRKTIDEEYSSVVNSL